MSLKQFAKPAVIRLSQFLGLKQSESSLTQASGQYWSSSSDARFRTNSHWRGDDAISGDTWSAIGRRHVELFKKFAHFASLSEKPQRIIDWGCGGGANAVAFAPDAEQVVGVDVAQASLDECSKQMSGAGFGDRFTPVLADINEPEAAANKIMTGVGPFDLFLCVYVFELIPGPGYAERILRIAADVLAPGGSAMIQFKYATQDWHSRPRRWAYKLNLANTTKFEIEAFWKLAASTGFIPQAVTLLPEDSLVGDERYAYMMLTKPN